MKRLKAYLTLDKLGSVGAVLAAAAAPCCFPLLAVVGGALGLGVLQPFKGLMAYVMQALVLLALGGNFLAWRRHGNPSPLIVSAIATLLLFVGYHSDLPTELVYAGLAGLLAAAVMNVVADRRTAVCCVSDAAKPMLQSMLTCPHCGFCQEETMPTDACLYFYDCPNCRARLKPKPGDCCVFCSYGTVKCPPKQQGNVCCATH